MATLASTPQQSAHAPPIRRKLRNYLLDARFQLKFTGYILLIALCIAGLLFIFLWSSTQALMHETELAVEARSRAAETSRDLSSATLNNKLVEHLNDPTFDKELQEQSSKIDSQYEAERKLIVEQRAELVRRQRSTWLALIGCLVGFVVFIALATIVTTHKVVGPLFRIKRMVAEIGDGKLVLPSRPLREGDELQDLFESLTRMVRALRDRQQSDLGRLTALIAALDGATEASALAELRALEAEMKTRLSEPGT